MANYAIERTMECKPGLDNLTWGEYIKKSHSGWGIRNLELGIKKPFYDCPKNVLMFNDQGSKSINGLWSTKDIRN